MEAPEQVQALAVQRAAAKAAKDYAEADRLRAQIHDLGFIVTDTPDGFQLTARPPFDVLPGLAALASGPALAPGARCAVIVLIDGWPDDVASCLDAFLAHAPAGSVLVGVDCGNVDGAGLVLSEIADASAGRIVDVHLSAALPQLGWGPTVTAVLGACGSDAIAVMDLSTILDGDALTPILATLDDATVVASGWRGVDVDLADAWRSFVDAGPGEVDAILGYLMVVRTDAAMATPPHPKAKFYRNADMEWSLALRAAGGRLVIPAGDLPVHQDRHHGYHDSEPDYRDRESKRTYDRLLASFRGREEILRPRG